MMPKTGTITPMRTSEEAGMNKTVLEKRTAVEVIVVKPKIVDIRSQSRKYVGKRRTVGEEEPRRQVLESVPESFDFFPTEHLP